MINRGTLLWSCTLLVLVPAAFAARPPLSGFLAGGWDGKADRGYSFLAAGAAYPITDRQSLFFEATASHLYYDYPEGEGLTEVHSPGIDALAGMRFHTGLGTFSLGAGFEVRTNHIKRYNDGRNREHERGAIAAASWFFEPTSAWQTFVLTSYSHSDQYLWGRVGAKRSAAFSAVHAIDVGFDITAEGNPDARAYQAGPLIQIRPTGGPTTFQLRLGASYLDNAARRKRWEPYVGISFWHPL